jgi:hypothetical protein
MEQGVHDARRAAHPTRQARNLNREGMGVEGPSADTLEVCQWVTTCEDPLTSI